MLFANPLSNAETLREFSNTNKDLRDPALQTADAVLNVQDHDVRRAISASIL